MQSLELLHDWENAEALSQAVSSLGFGWQRL